MFGKIKIGARLSLGFGVLVAVGLATAAFAYRELDFILAKVVRMADQSQNAIGVVRIAG